MTRVNLHQQEGKEKKYAIAHPLTLTMLPSPSATTLFAISKINLLRMYEATFPLTPLTTWLKMKV